MLGCLLSVECLDIRFEALNGGKQYSCSVLWVTLCVILFLEEVLALKRASGFISQELVLHRLLPEPKPLPKRELHMVLPANKSTIPRLRTKHLALV